MNRSNQAYKSLSALLRQPIAKWGLLALPLLTACAAERPAINRVQANALSKEFFVGDVGDPSDDPVFFSRNMVIDASESQELVGISSASGLERIRFDITENTLFARRAYSVTGGDEKGESVEPNGDIIAAYRIDSHFDVRRAYSSGTGEELNVVEENTSDRPWYDREYFRVDWSENLVNSPVWSDMFYGRVFGEVEVTSVAYYESDPDSPNAPHFDPEDGYFDITSHFSVEPLQTNYWGQEIPVCFLLGLFTGSAIYSCDAQEAVVRTSFWRVDRADPDDDFEPFENTGAPRDIFGNPGGAGDSASLGIVTPPREHYDPGYGFTDEGLRRYMNVHDIWEQSHQTFGSCETDDDCEELTGRRGSVCVDSGACSIPCNYDDSQDERGGSGNSPNGTDDQCENANTGYDGSEGAQCSPRERCTIPYRDREVKPVAYFVNPEMPEALQDTVEDGKVKERGPSEDLIFTWNQALQVAVAHAREVECRRTAKQGSESDVRATCHDRYFETSGNRDAIQMVSYGGWGLETPKDDTDVLVTCHNPVRDYDPKVCGEPGAISRVGDVRKNFMIYWPYNTQAPYGGIGNWRGDPLTGQIIGGAATTIGRSTTYAAAQVRDLALVALGELDFEDITKGVSAERFQRELRDGRKPVAMSQDEIARRVTAAVRGSARDQASGVTPAVDLSAMGVGELGPVLAQLGPAQMERNLMQAKRNLQARPDLAAAAALRVRAKAEPLLDTSLELELITPDWLVDSAGLSPDTSVDDAVLERVSPLRGQDFGLMAQASNEIQAALGLRGICHLDALAPVGNPDISGMGRFYRAKYPDKTGQEFADAVYEDLWKESYKGIQLHEVGHSLGLLHNFTSSYDSMNFNPQYWQLRTQGGDSTQSCNGEPRGASDTCMGPRYLDPETDDELGQGSEPRPGISYFAHTSTMEYQNARFFESVGLGQYDVMAMGALYGRVLQTFDPTAMPQSEQVLYESNLDGQLSDDWIGRSESEGEVFPGFVHYTELGRQIDAFSQSRCRNASGAEEERAEWRLVHGVVCAPPPKDHAHWDDFVDEAAAGSDGDVNVARKLRVAAGRPGAGNTRWPFRYGGDIANSYPHVNPNDAGADLWELTQETIRKAEYEYPLRYFRRSQRGWDDGSLPSRTARSFYERLRSYNWATSFTRILFDALYDERRSFLDPADYAQNEEFREAAFNDDNRFRPGSLAQQEMFQAIAAMLMKPEPSQYLRFPNSDGVFDAVPWWLGALEDDLVFSVDAGDGRFLAPEFDSSPTGGGSWEYQTYVERGGFTVEKQLAARALTDGRPVLFSVSRDIYLDSRNVNINFRSIVPDGVDRLLGGVLAEDWLTTAPYLEAPPAPGVSATVSYRNLIDDTLTPVAADAIVTYPNLGYNQQIALLIFPQLFGRVNGDLTLSNKLRVWIEGSVSGEVDIPEAQQLRFSDPESGITYVARRFGDETFYGKTIETGIGSRMLQRANELLVRSFVGATDDEGVAIVDEFGRPQLQVDAAGAFISADDPEAYAQFRKYVGLLDVAVQVSTVFGFGPR